MKIAVFHSFLDHIGGAEIVALTLARDLGADLYTTNIDAERIRRMGFASVLPRIISLGRVPRLAPWRQQLTFYKFRRLNLRGRYDFFIIAGDWAMAGAVNNHPNLWYTHSPLNELWAFRDLIKGRLLRRWQVWPYEIWVRFNQYLTLKYARSVDAWVANSQNTRERIRRFYKQEATIIYPPVETADYRWQAPGDYWLSVNRLAVMKRIELQLEAFRRLPEEKLLIIGSYEPGVPQFENYKSYLEKIRPANVTLRHWVDGAELKDLYAGCRGLVATAQDEDFGMTAIEAMSAGKPVIAPDEGGYRESVVDGRTGRLIADIDAAQLAKAVREIGAEIEKKPRAYAEDCRQRALDFDTARFISGIRALINSAGPQEML